MGELASAVYQGHVLHVRSGQTDHSIRMPLYMLYLDLAELSQLAGISRLFDVEASALASFRREDYLGCPDIPLDESVRDAVQALGAARPEGAIRMLTQVRTFGYVFNPVTFYYCFANHAPAPDEAPIAVLSEITNTPWAERHRYLVESNDEGVCEAEFDKRFHVSPFLPMQQRYRFAFSAPGPEISVAIDNMEAGRRPFYARLTLKREPFSAVSLRNVLLRHPAMSLQAHAAIYAHAMALFLKRAQFYPHPHGPRASGLWGCKGVRSS